MWKLDDNHDGHAFNPENSESLSISPAYTVMHWRTVPSDNPNFKIKWDYTPLETFNTEEAARVYIQKFVERRNSNADKS